MEDLNYSEEIAPLTEEQWDRILRWHRRRSGREVVQGLISAKEFYASMEKIQTLAGHAQEQVDEERTT